MGGWISKCCGDCTRQNADPDERTGLIDEHAESTASESNYEPSWTYRGALPLNAEEQSILNKILSETATNVIDVTALEPHTMEQNDFLGRKERYENMVRTHLAALPTPWAHGTQPKSIFMDVPDPEEELSSQPISTVEYCLLENISIEVAKALETLVVRHKEELIVPFRIPLN